MAKYSDSLYGRISGRAVDTVAAQWKGIKYFRTYVKPSDPKSAAQVLIRTRFKECVEWCKMWNETVYKPYWSPLPKRESSYNAAVSANYKIDGELPTGFTGWVMHTGSMAVPTIIRGVQQQASSEQEVTWSTALRAGESEDDLVVVGAFYGISGTAVRAQAVVVAERSAGRVTVPASTSENRTYNAQFSFVVKKDRSAGSESTVEAVSA